MIQPIGTRILVAPDTPSNVTSAGLVLPGQEDKPITRGAVVALGKDIENIKIGDTVVFKKYVAEEVEDGDKTFLVLDLDDVIGIIL